MTELWTFSDKIMTGGKNEEHEDPEMEKSEIGGLSVSQFFCKNKPAKDSETYPFFEPFIVPHGLVYLPIGCESNRTNEYVEEEEEHSMCDHYDKLFFLAAKNLGKSRYDTKTTRKKIPK